MTSAIALFASARRHGNTGRFIDRIAAALEIDVIDLAQLSIAPYDYDHRNRHDDFEPTLKRVLAFDRVLFATPVYWYAAAPAMKAFLDRITDFLELPDLVDQGRHLRGKQAYVVCTSVYPEVPPSFLNAFLDTFSYLGMRYGGVAHANCSEGYTPAVHDAVADEFVKRVLRPGAPPDR